MFDTVVLQEAADLLVRKRHTLAVAESVTAGLLQVAFAAAENASLYFQGGITAYNAKQKYTHLHVDVLHALTCNCVSETVASEMAIGAGKIFLSDWGIGVTGYASALPGHDMNPLHALFAISYKNNIVKAGKITAADEDPLNVQLIYVNSILKELLMVLDTID